MSLWLSVKTLIYVKIKIDDRKIILAKDRLSVIQGEYEVLQELNGKELEGIEYEQLLQYVDVDAAGGTDKKAFYVTLGRLCKHGRRFGYCAHCTSFWSG
jgi:isoleucyl-tRNA synthetase